MKRYSSFLTRYAFGGLSEQVTTRVQAMFLLKRRGLRWPARLIRRSLERKFSISISMDAEFEGYVRFKHPLGTVIGPAKIGNNVTIYQNVTLGGARMGDTAAGLAPEIGADTTIFAGAKILGGVRVGRNCVIGANAVVRTDMPDNALVVGVPARAIARGPLSGLPGFGSRDATDPERPPSVAKAKAASAA